MVWLVSEGGKGCSCAVTPCQKGLGMRERRGRGMIGEERYIIVFCDWYASDVSHMTHVHDSCGQSHD